MRGLEAMSIGFVWVGYVIAGAALGWWLDGHFKTGFWLPTLVMVGAGAGFRDLLVFAAKASRQQRDMSQSDGRAEAAPPSPEPLSGVSQSDAPPTGAQAEDNVMEEEPASLTGLRIPPPPEPTWSRKSRGEDAR